MSEEVFLKTKYSLIRKISEGASSHVFLVELDGKQYALKSLKTATPDNIVRFRRESSTLARLNHPNLVKLVDAGEKDNLLYLVMEYLDGQSLATRLSSDGPLSETESLKILNSLAGALDEVHKSNLIHRDIKPANIFLSKDGIKLIDFGLVGDVGQIKSETALVGTPLYCSPEQTKILNRDVSFYSDFYSLGIVFFEMLTGAPPFTGSLNDILQQHTSTPVPNLRILKPEVREAVVAIIEKLLAKDPDDRYQSAKGLLHDLGRLDEIDLLLSQKQNPRLGGNDKQSFAVRTKFIERTDEIEKLHKSWLQGKSGNPGIYIVKGASGSGKTRLCNEFIARLIGEEKKQLLVLRGKSQFFDRDMPFGAIREAIDSWMRSISNESPEIQGEIYHKLSLAAEGQEAQLIKLSKNLMKAFKKTNQENVNTDVEGEREKFFNSIVDFFIKLSQQWKGLLFIIDDLQWLDGSSIQLLDRLINQSGQNSIFILGTARNDNESRPAIKSLEEALGEAIKGQLEIGSFTKGQMSDLLSSYLGANQLESSIVDLFYSKSNGNPFIATEYLRVVVEQGYLVFKNNNWQMKDSGLEKLTFSQDVYQLIVKRVDGCSPELKDLLQYASLYGNTFTAPDMGMVAKIDSLQLSHALTEGERLGLLDRVSDQKWKFSHDKIPESLRQKLSSEIFKEICDKLAHFYQKKQDKSDDEIFILARLAASGNFENDLEFTISTNTEAGRLSLTNHAHGQAYTFFKCAFELSKKTQIERSALLEISSKLATCSTMIFDWTMAEECVQKALDVSQGQEELADSLALKVWVKKARGDITTSWESFRLACNILGHPYPVFFHWKLLSTLWMFFVGMFLELTNIKLSFLFHPESKRAKNLSKLADLYFEAQLCSEYRQLLDFILVSLKILVLGQMTGRKRDLALGYASTGYAFASLGVRNLAVSFLNKAIRLAEELNDPVVKASCISRRIEGFLFCGESYDETTEFKKNFDFTKRYLNPADMGRVRNNRTLVLAFKGRNIESLEFLRSYLNLQNPESSKMAVIAVLHSLHQYWFNLSILGHTHETQAAKQIALKICSPYRFIPVAQRHVAVYELQLRRYLEETDELVNDLREHYMANFSSFTEMNGKLNFSQMVFLDLYELEKAKSRDEKLSIRKRFKTNLQRLYFMLYSPLYRINYYLLKAMYYRIAGNLSAAQRWLNVCEKTAGATGHVRIMFEVQREFARIHLQNGNILLMKPHLTAALEMASENQWRPSEEGLFKEFGEYAGQLATKETSSVTQTGSVTKIGPESAQGHGEDRFVDALLKVSQAFVSSLDLVEQSKSVLAQIVKLFAAERGFVFIKDEGAEKISILTGKDAQGGDLKIMAGYSSAAVRKVFETAEPLIIASSDEAEALGSESAVLHNLRSIIVTPLKIKDQIFGVVYMDSSLMKGLFTKKDIHLFSTLANNISVAFELSKMAKVELEKAGLRKELEIQAAIASESKKVKVLVDNMQQALFSIAPDGSIVEPVSKFSEKVLGHTVAGEKLTQSLYKDVTDKEALTGIDTAINTVFGEDELQWDLMSDQFPRKIKYKSETEKILKVQLSPVWDTEEKLEKIVFVVEDITALEELEKRLSEQNLQAKLTGEILENDFQELSLFITDTEKKITILKENKSYFTSETFSSVLRDLHTLKGGARLFNLSLVSSQVHESESTLVGFKDNLSDQTTIKKTLDSAIDKIDFSLNQYQSILSKLSPVKSASSGAGVSEMAMNNLTGILAELEKNLPSQERGRLKAAVKRLSYRSVKEMSQKYGTMVTDISQQMNKKIEFSVDGDALIDSERSPLLRECLLHLLRNSIDHGLETGDERVKAGKSGLGHLKIDCREESDSISISIKDDGRGIDGAQVVNKAIQRGLVTEAQAKKMKIEDKVNLIFSPGFSTKDEVSEISGRGIGLDVVKKNVETMNGELKVFTEVGQGTQFQIRLRHENIEQKRAG